LTSPLYLLASNHAEVKELPMPDFEVFDKRAVPVTTEPMVTIQRKGPISMNRASFQALGNPQAVELLYDSTERIVGLRKVPISTKHAYPVRSQGKGSTFLVAAHAFTRYYSIPNEVSTRYAAQMFGDVLGIDLKQKGLVVTSNRARANELRNGQGDGSVPAGGQDELPRVHTEADSS
jgi:hypothetical protein